MNDFSLSELAMQIEDVAEATLDIYNNILESQINRKDDKMNNDKSEKREILMNAMSSVIKELLPMRKASDIEESYFNKEGNRIVYNQRLQIYITNDSIKLMVKDMKTQKAYICSGFDFLLSCCKIALGEKQ
jgi:hypothetical protein